jgi:hypothetical protein
MPDLQYGDQHLPCPFGLGFLWIPAVYLWLVETDAATTYVYKGEETQLADTVGAPVCLAPASIRCRRARHTALGGRRLAVTVTSQRGVAMDRDRPIAMLDFSVSLVLDRPTDPVKHAVSQGSGRESCLGQGSLPASRNLPRGLDLCAAYGPQVPWDDTILSEAVHHPFPSLRLARAKHDRYMIGLLGSSGAEEEEEEEEEFFTT